MIIKKEIQDTIDKILLKKSMATALDDPPPKTEQHYSNHPLPEDIDPNGRFKERFHSGVLPTYPLPFLIGRGYNIK